eukprot:12146611-Ditylum_brightwellii.AAC.1
MKNDGHIPEEIYDELGYPPHFKEDESSAKPLMHPVKIALYNAYKEDKLYKEKGQADIVIQRENENKRKERDKKENEIMNRNQQIIVINK